MYARAGLPKSRCLNTFFNLSGVVRFRRVQNRSRPWLLDLRPLKMNKELTSFVSVVSPISGKMESFQTSSKWTGGHEERDHFLVQLQTVPFQR